eukprot:5983648-Pyramimonas_sp.AAC.1
MSKRYAIASRRFRTLKKIEQGGPQMAATCGHQVHGLPKSSILELRRRLVAVAGGRKHGRGPAALLDLRAPLRGTEY